MYLSKVYLIISMILFITYLWVLCVIQAPGMSLRNKYTVHKTHLQRTWKTNWYFSLFRWRRLALFILLQAWWDQEKTFGCSIIWLASVGRWSQKDKNWLYWKFDKRRKKLWWHLVKRIFWWFANTGERSRHRSKIHAGSCTKIQIFASEFIQIKYTYYIR